MAEVGERSGARIEEIDILGADIAVEHILAVSLFEGAGDVENDMQLFELGEGFLAELCAKGTFLDVVANLVEDRMGIVELTAALDDIRAGVELFLRKAGVFGTVADGFKLHGALVGEIQRIFAHLVAFIYKDLGLAEVFGERLGLLQDFDDVVVEHRCFLLERAVGAFAGEEIDDRFLNIGDVASGFADAVMVEDEENQLFVECIGLGVAVAMGVEAELGLGGVAERDGRGHKSAVPVGVFLDEFGGKNLAFEGSGLVRVFAFCAVDEPGEVVALEFAAPVLVFEVIDGVGSDHNAVVFPEAHHALGRDAGVLAIGDDVIILGQVEFEEGDEAFFTFVGFGSLEGFIYSSHIMLCF